MLSTAIIVFREVLEAALIISIVIAATRGVANSIVSRLYRRQQVLDGYVLAGTKKGVDDESTLFGRAQSLPRHVRFQRAAQALQI